eukprot:TRINITY_DN10243_c0_g1_i4.p1 TRINITY_DN10243_c0_g1~~TRINITY_DN10243_c0_g1_i4.p1  ORF type:complete len:1001 (+),score=266.51 TRINITY_DN10243_c0_g1_i4:133-3135(+)
MADTRPHNPNAPILIRCIYEAISDDAALVVERCLKGSAAVQIEHNRDGVRTYAFSRRDETDNKVFEFVEVYANEAVFWTHGNGVEDILAPMFTPEVRLRAQGVIMCGNGPLAEGVCSVGSAIGLVPTQLLAGFLDRADAPSRPVRGDAAPVIALIHLPGIGSSPELYNKAISLFNNFDLLVQSIDAVRTLALYRSGNNSNSLEILMVSTSTDIALAVLRAHDMYVLAPLRALCSSAPNSAGGMSLRMLGPTSPAGQVLVDIPSFSSSSCALQPLMAGFAVHPLVLTAVINGVSKSLPSNVSAVITPSSKKSTTPPPPPPATKPQTTLPTKPTPPPPAVPADEDHALPPHLVTPLFEVTINPFSHVPESVVFTKEAPGRSPHLVKKGEASSASATPPKGVLEVPLLLIIRKLCLRGALDVDLPLDLLFCQLERLRSLSRDCTRCNTMLAQGGMDERTERFLEQISSYGYPLRAGDKSVTINGIDTLIGVIEWAWRDVISAAREAIPNGQVSYRGLMEFYSIGQLVSGQSGSLGGTHCCYRVVDVYFSTMRSMYSGGKKFVFTIAVEFVIGLGQFVMAAFEEKMEEFEGERDVASLPFRVVAAGSPDLEAFTRRGAHVAALGTGSVYRAYRTGTFFPHRREGDRTFHASGAGRAMIDNARGLMLGHSPGAGFDSPGTALNSTLKAYRTLMRAAQEGESVAAQQERARVAQLQVFDVLPEQLVPLAWPAVVCFSFSQKCWGHVITDGLSEIQWDADAFERKLILPERTKELLLATAQLFVKGGASAEGALGSISQAAGSLVLLYGPPGTGKTATIYALAEHFQVPLYYLTFGELGTDVGQLEAKMNEALSLCSNWGAFVLLDEADALLEKREKGQLLLNSLVGVLLRTLDTFNGLLYVSSNRMSSFDPAALSRVTLAIHYPPLDIQSRAKIWYNVLGRASVDPARFDCAALAQFDMSGREVNAAMRLALALALKRQISLDQHVLMDALAVQSEFRKEFPPESW